MAKLGIRLGKIYGILEKERNFQIRTPDRVKNLCYKRTRKYSINKPVSYEVPVPRFQDKFEIILLLSLLLLATACASNQMMAENNEISNSVSGSDITIPAEYRGLSNPMHGNQTSIQAGKDRFQKVCVSCHGEKGQGDGPAASLEPAPPDFSDPLRMSALSDGYLYWRITEGGSGSPIRSTMPAWGSVFDENEIWELVTYLRTFSQ